MIDVKNKITKTAIIVSLFFSAFLCLHFFFGHPYVFRALEREKNRAKETQEQLVETQRLVRAIPKPRELIGEVKTQMEELKKKSISEKELPRMIRQLTKKSSELQMQIISVKPIKKLPFQKEQLSPGINKSYIELVVKTKYEALGVYMRELKDLSIHFTIETLSVEPDDDRSIEDIVAVLIVSSYTILTL